MNSHSFDSHFLSIFLARGIFPPHALKTTLYNQSRHHHTTPPHHTTTTSRMLMPFQVVFTPLQALINMTTSAGHCTYKEGVHHRRSTGDSRTTYKVQEKLLSQVLEGGDWSAPSCLSTVPYWSYPVTAERKLLATIQETVDTSAIAQQADFANDEGFILGCRLYIRGLEFGFFPELSFYNLQMIVIPRLRRMKANNERTAMLERLDPHNKKFERGATVQVLENEQIYPARVTTQRNDHIVVRYNRYDQKIRHKDLKQCLVRKGKLKTGTYVVQEFDSVDCTRELWVGVVLCAHGEDAYSVKWCGSLHGDKSTFDDILNKRANMADATVTFTTLKSNNNVAFPPSQGVQWSILPLRDVLSFPKHARIYTQRRAAGMNNCRDLLGLHTCPLGHAMVVSSSYEGNYKRGYICECCRKGGGTTNSPKERWFCHSCGYDICTKCWPNRDKGDSSGQAAVAEPAVAEPAVAEPAAESSSSGPSSILSMVGSNSSSSSSSSSSEQ